MYFRKQTIEEQIRSTLGIAVMISQFPGGKMKITNGDGSELSATNKTKLLTLMTSIGFAELSTDEEIDQHFSTLRQVADPDNPVPIIDNFGAQVEDKDGIKMTQPGLKEERIRI